MQTVRFKFRVILNVEVEAPDENDAQEMIYDTFGLGEDCGVDIKETEIAYLGRVK